MDIDKYLRFVATKIEEAIGRCDYVEVERLCRVCAETLLEKAEECSRSRNDIES